jgi:hypothetical protein
VNGDGSIEIWEGEPDLWVADVERALPRSALRKEGGDVIRAHDAALGGDK